MTSVTTLIQQSAIPENTFPVSRKHMYLFFILLTFCLRNFMYFVINRQSMAYHITVSVISLVEIVIIWEFLLFLGRVLEKKFPILRFSYGRIVIQIILTYGLSFVTGSLFFQLIDGLFNITYQPEMRSIIHLLYFLLIVVINLIYVGIIYIFNWKNDLIKLANVQRQQALVQYDALKNQMNPHFLFNALTSVNSLIHSNPDLATDFLQQLSKVYRYVLQHKEKETVSLSAEVTFITNYMALLKTRFEDAINFKIQLTEEAKEMNIVPVTLQILIENAIKHNVASAVTPLKIVIGDEDSFLVVQNNVNRKTNVESSNGQGMSDLKLLYQYLTDKPIEILATGDSYTVKIPLIST